MKSVNPSDQVFVNKCIIIVLGPLNWILANKFKETSIRILFIPKPSYLRGFVVIPLYSSSHFLVDLTFAKFKLQYYDNYPHSIRNIVRISLRKMANQLNSRFATGKRAGVLTICRDRSASFHSDNTTPSSSLIALRSQLSCETKKFDSFVELLERFLVK